MTKYNTLNVKLSNSQLNKLKSWIKNGTKLTLNLSSKLIGSSNDETNFAHKLLLSNTQVPRTHKAFANGSWANIRLSETRLSKMNSGGFLDVSFEADFIFYDWSRKSGSKIGVPDLAGNATKYYLNKGIN